MAKFMDKLHGLIWVCHLERWSFSFSFLPKFVDKTLNPSGFQGFTIPCLHDFIVDDEDKVLLCSADQLVDTS